MRVDVYHHFDADTLAGFAKQLGEISKKLDQVLQRETKIMSTLDDVITEVTSETTRLDSINALITGMQAQLADALSGTTLPPAVQAKVDAVFAGLQTNSAKIDTALNANVPPPAPTA